MHVLHFADNANKEARLIQTDRLLVNQKITKCYYSILVNTSHD